MTDLTALQAATWSALCPSDSSYVFVHFVLHPMSEYTIHVTACRGTTGAYHQILTLQGLPESCPPYFTDLHKVLYSRHALYTDATSCTLNFVHYCLPLA